MNLILVKSQTLFRLKQNRIIKTLNENWKHRQTPDYLFLIPRSIVGRFCLWYVRQYMNKNRYQMIIRGRHPHRTKVMKKAGVQPNYCKDIPVNLSSYVAIYINNKRRFN